ncbi:MAG: YkgJ family cysteine cluster protein [Terracidiphilus sp.]|nr:YkgJ family cysteine cluster protein [Terracidiphilus sp.]
MLPARDSELVQIVDAALADAAQRAGAWLACHAGCTQCCHGAFAIGALDAERLRVTMRALETENPALASAIRQRAEVWIAQYSCGFPGDAQTGVLGTSEADQEAFDAFANDAPCPALDPETGHCGVYAGRPMTCRVFGPPVRNEGGAFGHCELCFQGAPTAEVVACEMHVPHELEEQLLEELGDVRETVVAYALLQSR